MTEFEFILGKNWKQQCIAYGKSEPKLLDICFTFSHIDRRPKRKLKNCMAWYMHYAGPASDLVSVPSDWRKDLAWPAQELEGVPLKVIFPEMGDR
jgi:hypothetical protein